MGVSGIAKEVWDDTQEMAGYSLVPIGAGLDFEIDEIREELNTDLGI